MGWSGVLYAAIVVGWAAYLIPHALRRYDEAARGRSIERFSSAMRVLGRRSDDSSRSASTVSAVKPRAADVRTIAVPDPKADGDEPPAATAEVPKTVARKTAQVAAKRRRRVLLGLLLCTGAVAGAAAYALLPWWAVAVPAAISLLFLGVSIRQGRKQRRAGSGEPVKARRPLSARTRRRRAARIESAYGSATDRQHPAEDESTDEDGVAVVTIEPVDEAVVQVSGAVPAASADDEPTVLIDRAELGLWDPVPVTLPTYISKPKAARTIRTVDLSLSDTWTSGHDETDTALAHQAEQARKAEQQGDGATAEEDGGPAAEPRRAVGG